mmetsp:Transcript_47936/g.133693  ORF Transcript_47936/g.133693 Transcript_47936/m.133693 type:complete len:199 (+) Transcript_47936:53-649(+)
MRGINAVLVVLATLVASASAGFTEARTGIAFPDKLGGKPLNRLGVRTKGPIKVYAVGEYGDTFLLQMSYGVGAAKMSAALGDALKPRCGDSKLIADFEACLTKGLPNGAPKGTKVGRLKECRGHSHHHSLTLPTPFRASNQPTTSLAPPQAPIRHERRRCGHLGERKIGRLGERQAARQRLLGHLLRRQRRVQDEQRR